MSNTENQMGIKMLNIKESANASKICKTDIVNTFHMYGLKTKTISIYELHVT